MDGGSVGSGGCGGGGGGDGNDISTGKTKELQQSFTP